MKIIVWKKKTNRQMPKELLPLLILMLVAVCIFAMETGYAHAQKDLEQNMQSYSGVICDTVIEQDTAVTPVSHASTADPITSTASSQSEMACSVESAASSSTTEEDAQISCIYCEEIPLSQELQQYTYTLCEQENVPYALALAVIEHESNFVIDATHQNDNGTTDSGLMQLNDIVKDHVKAQYGVTDLLDPKQNLTAGIGILSDYLEKYSIQDAVMAYGLGENGMKRAKQNGITATEAAKDILARMEKYASLV